MGAVHPGDQRMSKHFRRSFLLGRLKTNGFELNALGSLKDALEVLPHCCDVVKKTTSL